jgi:hypothetical protein
MVFTQTPVAFGPVLPMVFDEQGGRHVRYWPLADIPSCTAHVRF